jgi:hypothetical protein
VFSILNKPYPYHSFSAKDIRNNFFVGLFIFLFLVLFQPFGISEWQTESKTFKLFCFGCISFIVPTLLKWFFNVAFKDDKWNDNWKVWKEILLVSFALLLIATGNLAYAVFIHLSHFNFSGFLSALVVTCLIGIFPVVITVFIKHNRFLILNVQDAEEMEEAIQKHDAVAALSPHQKYEDNRQIILTAENEKDKLGLFADQLLYIESADNYSNVVYLQGELKKRELIRSSLKRLESQIKVRHIVRCHRAFIVNLAGISHIEGNAQGYKISFKQAEDTVPVSRNYGKDILEQLKKLK